MNDEGEYSCEADNAVGSITATGALTVHCKYCVDCGKWCERFPVFLSFPPSELIIDDLQS